MRRPCTVCDMLRDLIAAHRACPAVLVTHLETLAGGDPTQPDVVDLRAALASNPSLTTSQRRTLIGKLTIAQGRARVSMAALSGAAVRGPAVFDVLGPTAPIAILIAVLEKFADPAGELARAIDARAGGLAIWYALAKHQYTPLDVKVRAALALSLRPDATPTSFVVEAIRDAVRTAARAATTPDELAAAASVATRLTNGANPAIAKAVGALRPLEPYTRREFGTTAWLTDPATPTDHIVTWISSCGGRTAVWLRALRAAPDPHGALAEAAFVARGGDSSAILRAVATSNAPTHFRQMAAQRLTARSAHTEATTRAAETLVSTGDLQYALRYTLAHLSSTLVRRVASRPDVTADVLRQLAEPQRVGLGAAYRRQFWSNINPYLPALGAILATHPASDAPLRARGRTIVQECQTGDNAAAPSIAARSQVAAAAVVRAADQYDPQVPGSDAASGCQMPVAVLTPTNLAAVPTLVSIVDAALDVLLPTIDTAASAAALLALADGFTGTLAELFETANTISA